LILGEIDEFLFYRRVRRDRGGGFRCGSIQDSEERGMELIIDWVPACAGMTILLIIVLNGRDFSDFRDYAEKTQT